jgi:hypothetical protein
MQFTLKVDGIKELASTFNALDRDAQQIASAALRAGLNVIANQIKADIDPKVRHVRKTVGVAFKRSTRKGLRQAKVGFRVGKKVDLKAVRSGRSRGGSGISGQNAHWWILGAGQKAPPRRRTSLTDKPPTGTMLPQQKTLVPDAYTRSQKTAFLAMQRAGGKRLQQMARKLDRKAAK